MGDIWILFALAAVVGKTVFYAMQKRMLDNSQSPYLLGYITSFYGLLFLGPPGLYLFITNPPKVTLGIYGVVAIIGIVEIVGLLLYLKALSLCDLGIASSLKKTKPTLVAVVEPIAFGIPFAPVLVAAATSTALGGYVVLMERDNLLAPLKRITEPGPLLAFATAFVYTGLSLASRFGASTFNPIVYGMFMFLMMTGGYAVLLQRKGGLPTPREHMTREYLTLGFIGAFRSVMVWSAYALAAATLVSMTSQLTLILDILVGGALFKEGNTKQRVLGAILILAGVAIALLH